MIRTAIVACLLAFLSQSGVRADVWTQFRGATGDGVSAEKNLPVEWSASKNVKWNIDLPGRANSSPVVTRNRVDITTQTEDETLWVISINRRTGDILRRTKVGKGRLAAKGPANLYAHRHNAATPTPIADEDRIWAFFGSGLLVCLRAENGQTIWKKDMVREYGAYDITFGMGSSPRLWGDLLYVSCMTKGASYVVAFDKKTGREKWKTERRLPAEKDGPDSYSTPVVDLTSGTGRLVISGSDHVNAYDLLSGRQAWISDGLAIDSPFGRIIASPVVTDSGLVIATAGNPGGAGKGRIIAVDSTRTGDVSDRKPWTYAKSTPDSSTPVVVNGLVFMCADDGRATCLNLKTGDVVWQKRLPKGPYHASLVAGDGKVYFSSTTGQCTVMKADDSGTILATNTLPGQYYATPAISDGVVYLRAYERLVAVGN